MNHLVIFCHPDTGSFDRTIADAVEAVSEVLGHDTRGRDLYRQNFDPVLRLADLAPGPQQHGEIAVEQRLVLWADMLTLIYPVWWAGMPALLKGYVDRVFSPGFAYTDGENSVQGLLTGKKVLIFNTTCLPSCFYARQGMHEAMARITDTGIFDMCGMEVLHHAFFGSMHSAADEARQACLAEVEAIASRYL